MCTAENVRMKFTVLMKAVPRIYRPLLVFTLVNCCPCAYPVQGFLESVTLAGEVICKPCFVDVVIPHPSQGARMGQELMCWNSGCTLTICSYTSSWFCFSQILFNWSQFVYMESNKSLFSMILLWTICTRISFMHYILQCFFLEFISAKCKYIACSIWKGHTGRS